MLFVRSNRCGIRFIWYQCTHITLWAPEVSPSNRPVICYLGFHPQCMRPMFRDDYSRSTVTRPNDVTDMVSLAIICFLSRNTISFSRRMVRGVFNNHRLTRVKTVSQTGQRKRGINNTVQIKREGPRGIPLQGGQAISSCTTKPLP